MTLILRFPKKEVDPLKEALHKPYEPRCLNCFFSKIRRRNKHERGTYVFINIGSLIVSPKWKWRDVSRTFDWNNLIKHSCYQFNTKTYQFGS
ncbi:MAG: hypothetical protein KR126chlam5_00560 [Candidatus Anoxychlamydiales bacterium]|nr:hypothetical protein [Candidatus Anoxychlamydiales bacterium]